jgi:hypothetical protein
LFQHHGETGNHGVSGFHHLRPFGPPLNPLECGFFQIPSDLVVKSQVTDIIDLLLQLIKHPNGGSRTRWLRIMFWDFSHAV